MSNYFRIFVAIIILFVLQLTNIKAAPKTNALFPHGLNDNPFVGGANLFMEKEIFKDIVGYEGLYKVSNLGNIFGLKRNKKLKTWKHRTGYVICKLYANSKSKCFAVHRLMANEFIDNISNKPQVNHINGVKHDNRIDNLEWCNNSENQIHAYKNNLHKKRIGVKHHSSIPIIQYSLSNEFIREWESSNQIEVSLGYWSSGIRLCCHGKLKKSKGYIWNFKKE